jgi:hypothetical protein
MCDDDGYDDMYGAPRDGGWNDGALKTARKTPKTARHSDEKHYPGRIAGGVYTNIKEEPVEAFSGAGRRLGG